MSCFLRFLPLAVLFALAGVIGLLPLTTAVHEVKAQPADREAVKHAVLVAVNNYTGTGFTSLQYAVSDIEKLQAIFERNGFKVTVVTNKDATKKGIEQAIKDAVGRRQEGELLLLAMSGHGVEFETQKGTKDAFFCPADVTKANDDSYLSLTAAVASLGEKGPNLVLIDACRDDPKKGVSKNVILPALTNSTGVFLSCAEGQSSFETNRMYKDRPDYNPRTTEGHGVFFYHVLRALEGEAKDDNGRVTWTRLQEYLGPAIRRRKSGSRKRLLALPGVLGCPSKKSASRTRRDLPSSKAQSILCWLVSQRRPRPRRKRRTPARRRG